ncbi:MAG: NUDIX domain-containing protein [Alphaproteobacteria bacterium]
MSESPNSAADVELIEKTTPYQGYFRIHVYRLRHKRFGGGWTEVMSRELFERGHATVVLPYDPARDTVVLIEQFRVGAYAAGIAPWLIEVVAGIVEPGESPEEVARREAVEEAGCEITELEPIGTVMSSPGGCSEVSHLYCGRVDSEGIGGIHGLEHEHEDIRAFTLPLDAALERLARGEYNNASTVITLQWLALNRDWLKKKWS